MRLTSSLVLTCCMTIALAVPSPAAELPERCREKPVNGPCKALIEKYHFDQQSRKCKPYFYDGCGEVVPFDTLEECRQLCEEGRPEPKKRGTSGLYYDPIEEDPRHAEVFSKIDAEVNEALGITTKGGGRGYIHVIWETKKRLLKHKYNIDWRTPAELNPHVMFD